MLTMKVGLLAVFLLSSFVVSSNATAARLNFSPNGTVNLGSVVVGSSGSSISFSVANTGRAISACSTATLSGSNSSEFILSGASSCNGGIAAYGSCSGLSVVAKPLSAGSKSANLKIVCGKYSSGAVVWNGTSSMNLKLFLPETSDRVVSDSFVLPYSLISGYYSLSVVIRDPVNYRKPLPLAILGRSSDGSYLLSNLALTFRSYKAPNGALLN